MKKRFISLILALCLMCSCILPAYAAGDVSGSDVTSGSDAAGSDAAITDKDIKSVFDAYTALDAALDGTVLEDVKDALDGFNAVLDIFNEFDEAQHNALGEIMGCSGEEAFSNMLSIAYDANILTEMNDRCEAFKSDGNPKNALSFVEYYDYIYKDPEYADADLQALINRFIPDINAQYTNATEALPSAGVLLIYNAYNDLSSALDSWTIEELESALVDMDTALNTYSTLSNEDKESLGSMLGLTADEAFDAINAVNDCANTVYGIDFICKSFSETPGLITAKSVINVYEALFCNDDPEDEQLREYVRGFIFDIDEIYADACEFVPEGNYTRLNGAGRIETAIAIANAGFPTADNVIIASGDDFADALAGVPLAYALGAPILLVRNHGGLSSDTLAEINRLGAKNVFILGGTFAVSSKVESQAASLGCDVYRIAGEDRFGTSLEIAKLLKEAYGSVDEIFFVYSHNYPDALSISSVAALKNCPILYIGANGVLKENIAAFVKTSGAERATVISGPAIVSEKAESSIKNAGLKNVNRIYGANRYETCIKINKAYSNVFFGYSVCVATGQNYPDALAGGVFAALNGSPMLLADGNLSASQKEYLTDLEALDVYVFGGTGAVSNKLADEIAEY